MRNDKTVSFTSLVVGVSLLGLVSCGNKDNKSKDSSQMEALSAFGMYSAKLAAINPRVEADMKGKALIESNANEVRFEITVTRSAGSMTHRQYVYNASACPSLEKNDANKDGRIDVKEANLGDVFIQLDGDLNTKAAGVEHFPDSNSVGNYVYAESAARSYLMRDLGLDDSSALSLEGKVLVVHGIHSDDMLPVACGVITRVKAMDGIDTTMRHTGHVSGRDSANTSSDSSKDDLF